MTEFTLTGFTAFAIFLYGSFAIFSPDVSFNVDLVWKALLFVFVLDIIINLVEWMLKA